MVSKYLVDTGRQIRRNGMIFEVMAKGICFAIVFIAISFGVTESLFAVPTRAKPYVFSDELQRYIDNYNQHMPRVQFHFEELNFLLNQKSPESIAEDIGSKLVENTVVATSEAEKFLEHIEKDEALNRQLELLIRKLYAVEGAEEFELILQEVMYRYLVDSSSRRALNLFFIKAESLYYSDSAMRERLKDDSFLYHYQEALVPAGVLTFGLWFTCARYPVKCRGLRPDRFWKQWRTRFQHGIVGQDTIEPGKRLSPYIISNSVQKGWHINPSSLQRIVRVDGSVVRRKIDFRWKGIRRDAGGGIKSEGLETNKALVGVKMREATERLNGFFYQVFKDVSPRNSLADLVAWTGLTFGLALPIGTTSYGAQRMNWIQHLELNLQNEYYAYQLALLFQLQCSVADLEGRWVNSSVGFAQNSADEMAEAVSNLSELVENYNFLLGLDPSLSSPNQWPKDLSIDEASGSLYFRGEEIGACDSAPKGDGVGSLVPLGKRISELVQHMRDRSQEYIYWRSQETMKRFVSDFESYVNQKTNEKAIDSEQGENTNVRLTADLNLMRVRLSKLDVADASIPTAKLVEDFFRIQWDPAYTTREPRKLAKFMLSKLEPSFFNELMIRAVWTFIKTEPENSSQRWALLALFNEISRELSEKNNNYESPGIEVSGFLLALFLQQGMKSPGEDAFHFLPVMKSISTHENLSPGNVDKSTLWKSIEKVVTGLDGGREKWLHNSWLETIFVAAEDEKGELWRYWQGDQSLSDSEMASVRKLLDQWESNLRTHHMDPFVVVGLAVQAMVMQRMCLWRDYEDKHGDASTLRSLSLESDPFIREQKREQLRERRLRELETSGFIGEVSELARLLDLTFASLKAVNLEAGPDDGAFNCLDQVMPTWSDLGSQEWTEGEASEALEPNAWATLQSLAIGLELYLSTLGDSGSEDPSQYHLDIR